MILQTASLPFTTWSLNTGVSRSTGVKLHPWFVILKVMPLKALTSLSLAEKKRIYKDVGADS